MATRMQQRRGTAATWTAANPILAPGELGFEIDTNKFKIGDGSSRWDNLTYFTANAAAALEALIDSAPGVLDTLNELAAAVNDDPNFFSTVATNLSNHEADTTNIHGIANTADLVTVDGTQTLTNKTLTSPSITNPTGIVKVDVGLANVDNTSDADKPVSTATQTELDLKAPKASPTFTGTVSGVTKSMVGLGNVDNTSDADKPVSTAQAAADTAVADAASADATSKANAAQSAAISAAATDATTKANAALSSANTYTDGAVANLIDSAPGALDTLNELAAAIGDDANYASTITNSLALKAPIESPTFTGTVSGVTKTMVGLANVDNTSDADKPVSTATQTELDLKAPKASPTFTGTVVLPTVTAGGNIVPSADNTYDLGSPTNMWKDIYVGPGSLYVNGQKVLQDESGAIVVSADINENLGLRTSGSGNIELDPTGTGVVNIKGSLVMEAGANVTSADGNSVTFGGSIAADSVTSKTANTDLSLSGNGTGKVYVNDNAEVGGNLTVTGNLSVGGTVTTINSETISLADNIIDLNSNLTTGAPTENSGIRVIRGDESNVQVRWNETTDKWQFTNDGSVFFDIAPAQSPTFTGTPLAPTAGVGTDTTQVATTAFVKAAIQDISSLNLVLDGGGV